MSAIKYILFLFIFLSGKVSLAQSSNIGYFTYESFSIKGERSFGPTERELYFNKEESMEIVTTEVKTFKMAPEKTIKVGLFNRGDSDTLGVRIYRNLKSKSLITRRPDNPVSDAFVVHEDWVTIDWKVFPDKTKLIEGFPCQKAVGNFRGRTYEAWFTHDIPHPYGPWKLHGLPGLILEAKDHTGKIRFQLYDYDYPSSVDDKIIAIPTEGERISHQQEVYLLDHFDEIVAKRINDRKKSGSRFKMTAKPFIGRNPDAWELVYEWE
jgi:GLPGLI family protein